MHKAKVTDVLRVNISIPLWVVLSIGAIVFLLLYFTAPQYREHLKFVGILLASMAAIYSAYYVGATLRVRIDQDKLARSFHSLEQLNLPHVVAGRKRIEKLVEECAQLGPADLYDKIYADKRLLRDITAFLGSLEDIAIAISQGYVDEKVMYRSLCYIVTWNLDRMRSYIDEERKRSGDDRLFCEIECLARTWKERKLLTTGRIVPIGW